MSKVKKVIFGIASFLAVCFEFLEKLQKGMQIVLDAKEMTESFLQYGKDIVAMWQDFRKKPIPCAGMV